MPSSSSTSSPEFGDNHSVDNLAQHTLERHVWACCESARLSGVSEEYTEEMQLFSELLAHYDDRKKKDAACTVQDKLAKDLSEGHGQEVLLYPEMMCDDTPIRWVSVYNFAINLAPVTQERHYKLFDLSVVISCRRPSTGLKNERADHWGATTLW